MHHKSINYDLITETPFVRAMGGFRGAIKRSLHDKHTENSLRGQIHEEAYKLGKEHQKPISFRKGKDYGIETGKIEGVKEYIGVGANYMYVPPAHAPVSFHATFPSVLEAQPLAKEYFARTEAHLGMAKEKADLLRAEQGLLMNYSIERASLVVNSPAKGRTEEYKSKFHKLEMEHNKAISELKDSFQGQFNQKVALNVAKPALNLQQDLSRTGTKISKIPIVLSDEFNLYNTQAIRDSNNKIAVKTDIRDSRTNKETIEAEKLTEYIQRPFGKEIVTVDPVSVIPPFTPKKLLQIEAPQEAIKEEIKSVTKQLDFTEPNIDVSEKADVKVPAKKTRNKISKILKPDIPHAELVPEIAPDPKSELKNEIQKLEDEIQANASLLSTEMPAFTELGNDLRTKIKNALRNEKSSIGTKKVTAENVKNTLKISKTTLTQNIDQAIKDDDVIQMYKQLKKSISVTHAKTYKIPFEESYKDYKKTSIKLAKLDGTKTGYLSELNHLKKQLSGL